MTPDQAKTLIKWIADVIDPNAIAESMEVMDANNELYPLRVALKELALIDEFENDAACEWARMITEQRTVAKSKEVHDGHSSAE